MAKVDPSSPIPESLGAPVETYQAEGDGSTFGRLMAMMTGRKHPFGVRTVTVCENGIAVRDSRHVANPQVLANLDACWDDFIASQSMITRTVKGVFESDFNVYDFELADGTHFGFSNVDGMPNADRLAGLIHDEVFKRQFPRIKADFDTGNTVSFGPIKADKSNLTWNEETIPWSDISQLTGKNGYLVVEREGKDDLQMYFSDIKNFDIFWTIASTVAADRVG